MSKNNGGPAFPSRVENHGSEPMHGFNGEVIGPKKFSAYPGINILDYFAAKALQGLLSWTGDEVSGSYHSNSDPAQTASMAYQYAEAMMREREK